MFAVSGESVGLINTKIKGCESKCVTNKQIAPQRDNDEPGTSEHLQLLDLFQACCTACSSYMTSYVLKRIHLVKIPDRWKVGKILVEHFFQPFFFLIYDSLNGFMHLVFGETAAEAATMLISWLFDFMKI